MNIPTDETRPRPVSNGVNHLTRWFTRRHPRYIRSIVYMLQASEYVIWDFVKWHERTNDFRNVEKRKKLKFTTKATALLLAGWATLFFVVIGALRAC